jgi:hypothetical protein
MNILNASALESQFPRIAEQICLMWGHPEMDIFFARLAVDDRGDRQGFPPDVMSELMSLSVIHSLAYHFESAADRYANRNDVYQAGIAFH